MSASQTDWVWADDSGGMQGASADLDGRTIRWYDAPGCGCGDHADEQPIAEFLARGSRYLNPPHHVVAQMHSALAPYA